MRIVKIKLTTRPEISNMLAATWKIFAQYVGIEHQFVDENHDLLIGEHPDADILVSKKISDKITAGEYGHSHYFDQEPLIYTEAGKPDYLGTCFYMLNCIQEYNDEGNDKTGRFLYEDSYQNKFNCVEDNLVAIYFDKLLDSVPLLKENFDKPSEPSRYFLSHDNDVLHGSFMQDGLYALKHGRFDIVLKLIFNEILRKPAWRNMSRIMDIEDEYDIRSTFFWLVNQGKHNGIDNADYDINNEAIQQLITEIDDRGWVNGLHKSTSNESYSDEMNKLNTQVSANRNHFLRINLPSTFEQIESAGVTLDCSVGFAEKIGFRTGYALPFQPFNMERDCEFNLIEISLHIMDATLYNYEKSTPAEGMKNVLDFLEMHKRNSVISILWHNKYFTRYKYKGYLEIYKSILDFMAQNQMSYVTPKELTDQYLEPR